MRELCGPARLRIDVPLPALPDELVSRLDLPPHLGGSPLGHLCWRPVPRLYTGLPTPGSTDACDALDLTDGPSGDCFGNGWFGIGVPKGWPIIPKP